VNGGTIGGEVDVYGREQEASQQDELLLDGGVVVTDARRTRSDRSPVVVHRRLQHVDAFKPHMRDHLGGISEGCEPSCVTGQQGPARSLALTSLLEEFDQTYDQVRDLGSHELKVLIVAL
jgi:hypothetical protein